MNNIDINRVKLDRLKAHFDDDGASNPEAVARVIKGKPENVEFLRAYVAAAAEELKQPEVLIQFNAASTSTPDANPIITTSLPPEDPETVIESVPEELAEITRPVVSPVIAQANLNREIAAAQTGAFDKADPTIPLEYRYKDANGISHILVEVHRKGSTVVLGLKPTDEIVEVQLKGQPASLNLTALRKLSAGDDFTVNGNSYPVATLIVIAEAAKA